MSASAAIAVSLLRRAFGRRARPSDPHRTTRVRIGSSRLRAPLSMVSMHASTANHNGQGFPMSAHRTGRAVFPHPALGRVSHHGMHKRLSRLFGRDAQRLLESPGQARSLQALANLRLLNSSRRTSNQGSFPPRWLCCPPSAIGTMSPSDFPRGSTLMMERGSRLAAWDLPCCPVCYADVPRPLPRRANPWSSVGCSHGHQRPSRLFRPVGPRDFTFEACSGFTHVAARRLADPPTVGLCPKSFDQSVALRIVLVATGVSRQLPRQDLHL